MTDPRHDPFEDRLSEQLAGRADQMPIRVDGLSVIRHGVRRRRHNRMAAWTAGALVLVLVVVGGTVFGTHTNDSAPYVDTNTTTTTDPNVPATIPTEPLPALAPADGSGYSWRIGSWAGSSGYMLVVSSDDPSNWGLLRVQDRPWTTASTETVQGPNGLVLTVERSGINEVNLAWELAPGVTASVGTIATSTSVGDPVQKGLAIVASLKTVEEATWRSAVTSYVDNPNLLIGDPTETHLIETDDDPVTEKAAGLIVDLWVPAIGWGQLQLDQRFGFMIPPDGTPVSVRGARGILVGGDATSSGGSRTLQWTENSCTYRLIFGPQITVEQAVAYADRLRPIRQDELDQFLFPTWKPDEVSPPVNADATTNVGGA